MLPQQEQQQEQQGQQQQQQHPHQLSSLQLHTATQATEPEAEQAGYPQQDVKQCDAAAAAQHRANTPSTAADTFSGPSPVVNAEAGHLGSNSSGQFEDAAAEEDEYEDEGEDEYEDEDEGGSQDSLPLMQQAWKPDYTFKVSCCCGHAMQHCVLASLCKEWHASQ
jgi:hypothetical protein